MHAIRGGDEGLRNVFVSLPELAGSVTNIYQARCENHSNGRPKGASWMGDLGDIIGQLRLPELTMLGSHDSATYNITPKSESTGEVSSALPSSAVSMWGKAQHLPVYKQLNAGCRYIDLRLMPRGQQMWTVHGLFGSPFREVADDIERFLCENPQEVLVLDFQRVLDSQSGSLLRDSKGLSIFLREISLLADRYIPTSDTFTLCSATLNEVWSLQDCRRRIFAVTPESMWVSDRGSALIKDQHPDTVSFYCAPQAVLIPCREPLFDAQWYNEGEVHRIRQRMPEAAAGRVAFAMRALMSECLGPCSNDEVDGESNASPGGGHVPLTQKKSWPQVRLKTASGSYLSAVNGYSNEFYLKETYVPSVASVFTIEECSPTSTSLQPHVALAGGGLCVVRSPNGLFLSASGGLMGFKFVDRESLSGSEHFEVVQVTNGLGERTQRDEMIALRSVGYDGFVRASPGGIVTADRLCGPERAALICERVEDSNSLFFTSRTNSSTCLPYTMGTVHGSFVCVGDGCTPSHRQCLTDFERASPQLFVTLVPARCPSDGRPRTDSSFDPFVSLQSSNGQFLYIDDGGRVLLSAFADEMCVFRREARGEVNGVALLSFQSTRHGRFLSASSTTADLTSSYTANKCEFFSCTPKTLDDTSSVSTQYSQIKCTMGTKEMFLVIPSNSSDCAALSLTDCSWDPQTVLHLDAAVGCSEDFWVRPHSTRLCLVVSDDGRFRVESGSSPSGLFRRIQTGSLPNAFSILHLRTGICLEYDVAGRVCATRNGCSIFSCVPFVSHAIKPSAGFKSRPSTLYITGAVVTPDNDTIWRNTGSMLKTVLGKSPTLAGLEKYSTRLAGPALAYFEGVGTPYSDERWELLSKAFSGVAPSSSHADCCDYCRSLRRMFFDLAQAHQAHVCCCVRPPSSLKQSWWWAADEQRGGATCLWCRCNADRNVLQVDFVEDNDSRFASCAKATIATGLVKACAR